MIYPSPCFSFALQTDSAALRGLRSELDRVEARQWCASIQHEARVNRLCIHPSHDPEVEADPEFRRMLASNAEQGEMVGVVGFPRNQTMITDPDRYVV